MIKLLDELTQVTVTVAPSATTSTTGLNIVGLNVGEKSYSAIFNVSAIAGTVDGSNNWTLQLEVSDLVGGTYHAVGNAVEVLASGDYTISFNSEQIEHEITGADFFRVTATKVGTTSTSVTYGCYLTKAE
jgi:hypothetical protein